MKLENLTIDRFTIHKIISRTKSNPAPYAGPCEELVNLDYDGIETLRKRINACLDHKSKFFKLTLAEKGPGSFYSHSNSLAGSSKEDFITASQNIADLAALSHQHANIPDGLLLVVEAKISALDTIIIVKAEKSDAFSMTGTNLHLVKDIFLSSDKTLYKLGFFIRKDKTSLKPESFDYYVYDDSFSPSKGDLAFYFYRSFLGLTAEKNGKLLTNKLHRRLKGFIEDHIDFGGSFDLMKSVDRAFLDPSRKNINAQDFRSFFPHELEELYKSQIEGDFPNSFVKDNSISTSITTKRIPIAEGTLLLLKNGAPDGIVTGNTGRKKDVERLRASIDSGNDTYNFALIPTLNSLGPPSK